MARALRCPDCCRPLTCVVEYAGGNKTVVIFCDNEFHRPEITSGEQASMDQARAALEAVLAEWEES